MKHETLETVPAVDLPRFMGDWYVIAHIPTFIEKDACDAVEHYDLRPDGTIATTFTFKNGNSGGPLKKYSPVGYVRDQVTHATWGMQFLWPFKAEYLIAYLDAAYTQTIIARSARDYVWIMARTPVISQEDYDRDVARVAAFGYDTRKLRKVPQQPQGHDAAPMTMHAIEEPAYEVTQRIGDVEVRRYSPYAVAEVRVTGSATAAGNQAFPILAGYIFGKNKGQKKFPMTAPVTQSAAGTKMQMTAPVTQNAVSGGFVVQFVLPRGVTLAAAPEPVDPRVTLREEEARRVAVIRYSGFWSDANYEQHLSLLEQALRSAGEAWTGDPIYARYNAPFVPWFLRRNEIWLQLP